MRSRTGYPELVVCGLLWGSLGVVVKESPVAAPVLVLFRLGVGAVTVVAWFAARRRLTDLRLRRRRVLLVASGATLAVHWWAFFLAYKRLSVATVILIVYVGPVFMALFAPAVIGERLERRTIFSLGLSLAGIALIAVPAVRGNDRVGFALAAFAMATFVALVLIGKLLVREYPPPALVTWQLSSAAVLLAPAALAQADGDAIRRSLPVLVLLGAAYTGAAGILYFRAMEVVKAQHMGILAYLEPVTAVAWAWILLSETPSMATVAGGILIVAAGINVALPARYTGASAELPEPVEAR